VTDDEHDGEHADESNDEEDEEVATWPVKGPATPQQAIFAIGFVFFLGILLGFLLCRTF
jgi:hypothetical protein